MTGTCGFIAMWNNKRVEITQDSSLGIYHAKQEAIRMMKVPAKRQYEVSIWLAEKNGQPVTHIAVD